MVSLTQSLSNDLQSQRRVTVPDVFLCSDWLSVCSSVQCNTASSQNSDQNVKLGSSDQICEAVLVAGMSSNLLEVRIRPMFGVVFPIKTVVNSSECNILKNNGKSQGSQFIS